MNCSSFRIFNLLLCVFVFIQGAALGRFCYKLFLLWNLIPLPNVFEKSLRGFLCCTSHRFSISLAFIYLYTLYLLGQNETDISTKWPQFSSRYFLANLLGWKCMYEFRISLRFVSKGPINKWHYDVIKWRHFPCYWPFVRGIHRSRRIPRTKASDADLWCFLWSTPE